MARLRRAISGALAAMVLLIAAAAVLEDRTPGSMTGLCGPVVQKGVSWLRARHQRLIWSLDDKSEAVMDFDRSSNAEPVMTKDGGRLRISIPDGYKGKWIAIKAVMNNPLPPRRPLMMRATTHSTNDNVALQLGVYDGRDNGMLPETAGDVRDLSYDYVPLSESLPTQLKINIFPQARGACELIIESWEIYTF
jgi:hypothetical protein